MNNRVFFGIFALCALALVVYLFKPFLLNIFIAALLAVATSNVNVKFLQLTKGKRTLSAALTTLALFSLFIAPLLYAVIELAKHAASFNTGYVTNTLDYFQSGKFQLPEPIKFLEPKIKEIVADIDVKAISANLIANLAGIGKSSVNFLVDMIFILVFFFFAVLYGSELVGYLKSALPMKESESEFILSEVANVMSVVLYSIVINAILQGCLFAIITISYGYNGFLMGILFAFTSLVPVVGGLLAWGPISLYEFANGNTAAAIVIAVYTIVVISIVADTFLKPIVIKFINDRLVKIPTKINELLLFFSMIAGISTFGFWGLILGPAIVTFFISTIKLYTLLKERAVV